MPRLMTLNCKPPRRRPMRRLEIRETNDTIMSAALSRQPGKTPMN
jgi:hypothetical protein